MRRIALRLLLCLTLVLNGTGYAVAATQMEMTHMTKVMAAHAAEAKPPCHRNAPPEATEKVAHWHSASATGQAGSDVPDCCQSSKCTCDYCLQHLSAAISVIAIPADTPPDGAIAQPNVASRIAPPLPNLLRPPIG